MQLHDGFKIVLGERFILFRLPAPFASVEDEISAVFYLHANRLHHAAARVLPVAGMNVDMLAPEALRAVVGVTVAKNNLAAMVAGKIFNLSLEFAGHAKSVA